MKQLHHEIKIPFPGTANDILFAEMIHTNSYFIGRHRLTRVIMDHEQDHQQLYLSNNSVLIVLYSFILSIIYISKYH
jgi:hypothetical protein